MIIDKHELNDVRSHAGGATIALRFGSYDLLHAGHRYGLNIAASQADIMVVGIMPDEYVSREKGPDRPIHSQDVRVANVDAAEGVDYSFITSRGALGVARSIAMLRPDVYIEDQEHPRSSLKSVFLKVMGVDYITHERDRSNSTSLMIARLGVEQAIRSGSLTFSLAEELIAS